jgi:hypothetical protein
MKHQIGLTSAMNLIRIIQDQPDLNIEHRETCCATALLDALDWRDTCYTEAHKRSFEYKQKRAKDYAYHIQALRDKYTAYMVWPQYVRDQYRRNLAAHDNIIRLDKILEDARAAGWLVDKGTSIFGTEATLTSEAGDLILLKWDCARSAGPGILGTTGYIARLYIAKNKIEGIVNNDFTEINTFADALAALN